MAKKTVDTDRLNNAITNFDKALSSFDELIPEAESFLTKLDIDWNSPASDVYIQGVTSLLQDLKEERTVIEELKEYTKDAQDGFGILDGLLRGIVSFFEELLDKLF